VNEEPPASGAMFAGSFTRSFPLSSDPRDSLGAWFDLAIDEGRRQGRAGDDFFVHVVSAEDEVGQMAIRASSIVAVQERPDATVICALGYRLAVAEDYRVVLDRIGRAQ
jgi:hypothetical protein